MVRFESTRELYEKSHTIILKLKLTTGDLFYCTLVPKIDLFGMFKRPREQYEDIVHGEGEMKYNTDCGKVINQDHILYIDLSIKKYTHVIYQNTDYEVTTRTNWFFKKVTSSKIVRQYLEIVAT